MNRLSKMKLMRLLFFILLASPYSSIVFGQSILTGNVTGNDQYIDLAPDSSIDVSVTLNQDTILVDIDSDGIFDLVFTGFRNEMSSWFSYRNVEVKPLDGCEVAIIGIDTCFTFCNPEGYFTRYPVARNFSLNEPIDNNAWWIDSTMRIAYNEWNATIPNSCGYGGGANEFPTGTGYIGIRKVSLADTGYVWIRIKDVTNCSITLEEFGYNNEFLGIQDLTLENETFIFPNPAQDFVQVKNELGGEIFLTDLSGRLILKTFDSKINI